MSVDHSLAISTLNNLRAAAVSDLEAAASEIASFEAGIAKSASKRDVAQAVIALLDKSIETLTLDSAPIIDPEPETPVEPESSGE